MHWFHDPSLPELVEAGFLGELAGSEGVHAVQSLRIRVGEQLAITDGVGRVAICTVRMLQKQSLEYRVESIDRRTQTRPEIWMIQALAKGGRDELAIQAATELGVSGIMAWQADRSVVRWDEAKQAKGLNRWNQICIEASKQSQRSHFPLVKDELAMGIPGNLPGLTIVLEPTAMRRISETPIIDQTRINLIVGPEGGFEKDELKKAESEGYELCRLGPEILRTSSAGPAAIASIQTLLNRW